MSNFNEDPFGFDEGLDDSMKPIERKPAHLVLIDEIRNSVEQTKKEEETAVEVKTDKPSPNPTEIKVPMIRLPTVLSELTHTEIRKAIEKSMEAEKDPFFQAELQRQIKENKLYNINLAFEILSKISLSEEAQGEVVYFLEQIQTLPINDDDIRSLIRRHKPLEIAFAGDQTWHQILLKILRKARDRKTDLTFTFFFINMMNKCEVTDGERTEIIAFLERLIKESTSKSVRYLSRVTIEILTDNENSPRIKN